jgi:crotonobetaine/carnitine-CoA ligase
MSSTAQVIHPVSLPGKTIVEILVDAGRTEPDAPALIFEDGLSVSRGELLALVEDFAAFLRERAPAGSSVAIMLPNRTEFLVGWFAAAANEQALVSMNPALGTHDALHVLRDSGAKLLITDEAHEALVDEIKDDCPELAEVVLVGTDEPHGLPRRAGEASPLDRYRPDPAAVTNVYYTSGTTGPPKGCMVDHAYWLRFAGVYKAVFGLDRGERILCCLQFFYADPPWLALLSLHSGVPLVCMRRFSVSRFWTVCRQFGVTRLFGIGAIPMLLLKAPPHEHERNHRVALAVQVGIPTPHHRALEERFGFPWVEAYGLTETGMVVAMPTDCAERMVGSGSIGRACPDVELRVADDQGTQMSPGAIGELLIRAPGMMLGYLGRPDETGATLVDGWLRSGDLVHRDGDGFLYFHGRKKELIRRGGENLSPAEIESVLATHPCVGQAAVIPVPDDVMGEEVMAVVRVADGTEAPHPRELAEYCAARLARFKVPRFVCVRDRPFALTPSMRIRKEALRGELEQLLADAWDRAKDSG